MSVDSRFAAPALASLKDCALDDPRLPTPLFVIDSQKLKKEPSTREGPSGKARRGLPPSSEDA